MLPLSLHPLPAPPSLPVSETFTSIQGEGKLVGTPSHFIRLSGCNLRCSWCDTPYASWTPQSTSRTIDDLVAGAQASGVRHVVLTGGEPMMFPLLPALMSRLSALGLHITIETAGTIIPEGFAFIPEGFGPAGLISISPKLASSTPIDDPRDPDGTWAKRHDQRRLNIPVLQRLLDMHPRGDSPTGTDRQLKFVLTNPGDLAEIDTILAQLHGWVPDDVLLMPEGIAPPTRQTTDAVVAICVKRGFRYCPRLHIDLFGHTRGT